ncbi:MAG: hypothetical protein KGI54_06120 [Pseudomonadota bacterium]|nr:hypothetical protein [Pseudomonadota bacterium]
MFFARIKILLWPENRVKPQPIGQGEQKTLMGYSGPEKMGGNNGGMDIGKLVAMIETGET